MNDSIADYENIIIEGTYGDGEVRLCRCLPKLPGGVDVILLHGVHSSANLSPRNKFRHLAALLLEKGFAPWLVETSRKARCRGESEDVGEWAYRAFRGKTFAQEQEDVFRAVREVIERVARKAVWLWGFSLGGIIAASVAGQLAPAADGRPAIERLILSGTGLQAYPDVTKQMLKMPILSTLMDSVSADMLPAVRASGVVSFRGEFDEVFSLKSCLDFIEGIDLPSDRKIFSDD